MADDGNSPENGSRSEIYLRGVALFNQRQFWESHEAWEEIWLESDGTQSDFLQGLIQCAAALLKYQRHESAPALRLYNSASTKLSRCPDFYMGLNVRAFEAAMAECFQPVVKGPYQNIIPEKIPRIIL